MVKISHEKKLMFFKEEVLQKQTNTFSFTNMVIFHSDQIFLELLQNTVQAIWFVFENTSYMSKPFVISF